LLAAVERCEVLAVAVGDRRPLTQRIALRRLDLDDLRAEVGQQHAAERSGGNLAELDDLDTCQQGRIRCHGRIPARCRSPCL
jgi:hypothetical protein